MPPANILSHPSAPSGIDKLTVFTTYNAFPQKAVAYCQKFLEPCVIPLVMTLTQVFTHSATFSAGRSLTLHQLHPPSIVYEPSPHRLLSDLCFSPTGPSSPFSEGSCDYLRSQMFCVTRSYVLHLPFIRRPGNFT
ncbi:hypothetical protein M404DRAFT_34499 [Pisolithus tinctorius Marx 270]|uniref:Uncharacterized protein n=1 Tax=Pisolithus tinctorius Marx 270 TaxID=870435 RepID=A0A0C3JBH8_PISTI|nr:hypothetical protein M404DRAFT_34499 [Pisolithus tinctorius Marx 270]